VTQKATPIAPAQSRWRRFRLAETDASDHASAACYRAPEHIGIATVVITELKFGDVEWQILGADLVERADHAAFENAPKTLNRVRVDGTNNVFVIRVPDDLVTVAIDLPQAVVADPLVRNEQAYFFRNRFGHELGKFVAGHTTAG
jgi:hypothetical protein